MMHTRVCIFTDQSDIQELHLYSRFSFCLHIPNNMLHFSRTACIASWQFKIQLAHMNKTPSCLQLSSNL